uniref:Uncharacterized protein n=1 Tax=Arundo donax TaxID=35708 RepID=A0A0A9HW18_ARUDO
MVSREHEAKVKIHSDKKSLGQFCHGKVCLLLLKVPQFKKISPKGSGSLHNWQYTTHPFR